MNIIIFGDVPPQTSANKQYEYNPTVGSYGVICGNS